MASSRQPPAESSARDPVHGRGPGPTRPCEASAAGPLSEETERSEGQPGAAPRHRGRMRDQAPEEGEGETGKDQRQGHGKPCLGDEAWRGDQDGGATGEIGETGGDTSRGQTQDQTWTLQQTPDPTQLPGQTQGQEETQCATLTSSTSSTTASSTSATTAASAPTATATAASASTAAADTSTPATTPTATPTPSAASTATPTTPDSSTRALAPLALARAASPARGRRRTGRLKTNEVGRSGKGYRGRKGGRGTPLEDGGARVTTRGS
ncbi:unnamed protein product [Closterium sp. NIES-64]|nr:unnamed protein product [Closterium sp. NIES-64]